MRLAFDSLSERLKDLRPQVAILTGYWLYVALSNILYAAAMNANFQQMSGEAHFAPWDVRLMQHAVLYPALLVSVWASLKIGWRPLLPTTLMQLVVAVSFALLGAPALSLAETLLGYEDHKPGGILATWASWFDASNRPLWLASATSMLLAYGFGLALVTGFSLYRRYAQAQIQVTQLEHEFNAAKLASLRLQLSPHTLFNLLHAIHGQIAWEPKAAQAMIVKLGDLLRRLLRASDRDFSTLADEIRFAQLYLELQQQRFADRLSVELPAREALPALWVPSLILQPLVENAVVHGLAGHDGAVRVRVEAMPEGETLVLTVVNTLAETAAAGDEDAGQGENIGLRNVRERLAVQFGLQARFSAGPGQDGTWCAQIVLPQLRDVAAAGGRRSVAGAMQGEAAPSSAASTVAAQTNGARR
ncbi:MAG: histidine kinase [Proteobacteria bacterium]|nr:histidine kinase [Pseudomonadota bacterium]